MPQGSRCSSRLSAAPRPRRSLSTSPRTSASRLRPSLLRERWRPLPACAGRSQQPRRRSSTVLHSAALSRPQPPPRPALPTWRIRRRQPSRLQRCFSSLRPRLRLHPTPRRRRAPLPPLPLGAVAPSSRRRSERGKVQRRSMGGSRSHRRRPRLLVLGTRKRTLSSQCGGRPRRRLCLHRPRSAPRAAEASRCCLSSLLFLPKPSICRPCRCPFQLLRRGPPLTVRQAAMEMMWRRRMRRTSGQQTTSMKTAPLDPWRRSSRR